MRQKRILIAAAALVSVASAIWFLPTIARGIHVIRVRLSGVMTIQDRLDQYGSAARARLSPRFANAGLQYPPARVSLVGLKRDRRLLMFAADQSGDGWRFVCEYPILGASGELGPKLRDGDRQVPEGVYAIESLNPNSRFHLSLRVGYPNDFDRQQARADGRTQLGGDIMIHGGSASIGCLAMGDPAAEELFTLAADTGIQNLEVILTPVDLRTEPLPETLSGGQRPAWLPDLYARITSALAHLPGFNPPR